MKVIKVVYDNGVFRPLDKVEDLRNEMKIKLVKTSRNLTKSLSSYVASSDEDISKKFLRERR